MSDLVRKTKIGMFWNLFEKIGVQGISFILNIILARLLAPSDYGTIGLLTIFLTLANVFIESGFTRALIQNQKRSEEDFATSFYFNLIISIVIYIVLFFAAPLISAFYKVPELTSLQRFLFLVLIINSLSLIQNTKLQINVDFKKIALVTMIAQFSSGIIGILAALNGLGVWSLVIQSLVKSLINTILYWIISKWKPLCFFKKNSFKRLFGFGSKLLVSGFISTIVNNIESLIIGKSFGTNDLGYYTRGYQFPELISGSLSSVLNTSTFPLLASLQNDKEQFIKKFRKLICLTSLITYPMMTGLAVLSKNIILVLLSEKWVPASYFLTCVAFSYLFRPCNILNMNLLNAIGRSDLFLKVDLIKIPIDLIVLIITLPLGLRIFMLVKIVKAFVYFYINAFLPGKLYNFGPFKQLFCAWKAIVSTIFMGLIVFTLNKIIVMNEVLKLILLIFVGIVVYYISLKILKEKEIQIIEKKISNLICTIKKKRW